jgi:hypothetical protein
LTLKKLIFRRAIMFVIVGNMLDSADDSLWEIVGDTVEFGPVFLFK